MKFPYPRHLENKNDEKRLRDAFLLASVNARRIELGLEKVTHLK